MSEKNWVVWGVSELGGWIGHFPHAMPTGHDAEDCIDAHIRCGIRHIAWELGRSVVRYHSDLPDLTDPRDLGDFGKSSVQDEAVHVMYRDRCQLRAALTHAERNGVVIYGRLCMNRHYRPGTSARSQFAQNHPEWCEVRKDGWLDPNRLCYAIPEYRQERVKILSEAARIGCHGLCLDFCRQPPLLRYHPALARPYREKTGKDPYQLSLADKEAFLDWCQFRSDCITQMLRDLRVALAKLRARYDRPIPVQVRVPNDGFEANLIAGLDVRTWCDAELIDELALSELRWLVEYPTWDDNPYIQLGAACGIPVFASSNALPMQSGPYVGAPSWGGEVNPRGVNPLVLARRALRSLEDGAQGVCLYQTDVATQWDGLREAVRTFSAEPALRAFVDNPANVEKYPVTPENQDYGMDNHSRRPPVLRFRAGEDKDVPEWAEFV